MAEPLSFVGTILSLAAKAKEIVAGVDKKLLIASTLAVTVTTVILGGIYFIYLKTPAGVDTPESPTLGGLDLAKYCSSYNYEENDDRFCTAEIDLDDACSWQYDAPDLIAEVESGPYSGDCRDPQGESLGGISDMPGYCKANFRGSLEVEASVVEEEEKWVCRTEINMGLACTWQYQKENLQAREEGGIWNCYE
ncbi:hypothetical protein [Glycomyces salinus]|uniref:hypothetical protein n=1 Tax=Glycomyces salinus TaxID=980294 RepID=UPI0018EDC268|nr:hypothetical protein [Glycomyces salinus]